MNIPDIDIDIPITTDIIKIFPLWKKASLHNDKKISAHPCGFYPQDIPSYPLTNLASIPYEEAEKLGYIKLDFLHITVYDLLESREQIEELLKIEPNWELLQLPSVSNKLFQISKHADLLAICKPKSVIDLADILALIRPGKRNLLETYLKDRMLGRKLLYAKSKDGYQFKRSHAVSYALVIVLQLHLVSKNLI